MHRLHELPPCVQSYLRDFETRWRRLVVLRAVGTALAVLAVWIIGACLADRFLHLSTGVRLASLGLAGWTAVTLGFFRLRPIRGPIDWVSIASMIERRDARFEQALITVTSRVLGDPDHRGSDEILAHLLRGVEQRIAEESQRQIVNWQSAAPPWVVCLISTTLVLAMCQIPGIGGTRLLARQLAP